MDSSLPASERRISAERLEGWVVDVLAAVGVTRLPIYVRRMRVGVLLAVELAREAGAGIVSVRRSAHFGAASWYVLRAAEAGMAGLDMSQAEADVVPFGGREPAIGTNPLSLAVPGDPPVVVDMATRGVAWGACCWLAAPVRRSPRAGLPGHIDRREQRRCWPSWRRSARTSGCRCCWPSSLRQGGGDAWTQPDGGRATRAGGRAGHAG